MFTPLPDPSKIFKALMLSIIEPWSPSTIVRSKRSTMSPWVNCILCHNCHVLRSLTFSPGIKKSTKQDWIRIDRNYLERTALRKKYLSEHPEICLGTSEIANPAILELYEEVMLDLLPKRFPSMFRIKGDTFHNVVTGTRHCISSALLDHASMLRHLAENVEEDFYFMVPNAQDEFVLQGFVACFPQGLLPSAKVGMSVSEIHKPVPGYEGRLKKGVNRCFERMERGQSVGRLNVSSSQQLKRKESYLICHSGPFKAIIPSFFSHSKAQTPSKQTTVHPQRSNSTPQPPFCAPSITP